VTFFILLIPISEFPFSGHRVPGYDIDQIRELLESPYRIIYYIKAGQIDVLAALYAPQMLNGNIQRIVLWSQVGPKR